ncbi:glycosyltransferase family 2 protein [Larsenimonas salina]|uniref:glycosyltransferase family 2 protein n=1 Tax=Larsenimonas salina TaxID=1295565 RepID=UPI0020745F37|nr:glycosyltransferase [Larsenimonas salina]MCM5703861.1 glycosyltransferase [Larsenimonas salina]
MTNESRRVFDLSIVVPIYNASASLATLFKHLAELPQDGVEVVLVNDGSKDDSLEQCRRFETSRSNVCVIDQVNGGVSVARNNGIKAAQGDYIAFCDADDQLLASEVMSVLAKAQRARAEIAVFNYATICERDGHELNRSTLAAGEFDFDHDFLMLYEAGVFNPVFNKMFSAEFLTRHAIAFEEGVALGEDFRFNLDAFIALEHGIICSEHAYRYVVGQSESLTTSYNPKQFSYFVYGLGRIERLLRERGINDEHFLAKHWSRALINSAQNIAKRNGPANPVDAFKEFKSNACEARRHADLSKAEPYQNDRKIQFLVCLVRKQQDLLLFAIVFTMMKFKQKKAGV